MHKVESEAHSLARPPECRLSLLAVILLAVKCTINCDPCFQLTRLLCEFVLKVLTKAMCLQLRPACSYRRPQTYPMAFL